MADDTIRSPRDWVTSPRANALAWWLPKAVIIVGLIAPPLARTVMWLVALIWMGAACILNASRCGRIHCRYTGPYYLVMIVPVLVSGVISAGWSVWLALAGLIVGGGVAIWWATERAWGKFS